MTEKPCCDHSVERHAYNGCANCDCAVSWVDHPDKLNDRSRSGMPFVIDLLQKTITELTAARDELAKIARTREHPDYLPDFDVSLERINALCPAKPRLRSKKA